MGRLCYVIVTACLLLGPSCAWQDHTQYRYEFNGQSLSKFEISAEQTGIFYKGELLIQCSKDDTLIGKINELFYIDIDPKNEDIDEEENLPYKSVNFTEHTFGAKIENGLVKNVQFEEHYEQWEKDFVKSLLSHLQVDDGFKKAMENESFNVMEDYAVGRINTTYDVVPFEEEIFQKISGEQLDTDDQKLIKILKTKNFVRSNNLGEEEYQNFRRESKTSMTIQLVENNFIIKSSIVDEYINMDYFGNSKKHGEVLNKFNMTILEDASKLEPLKPLNFSSAQKSESLLVTVDSSAEVWSSKIESTEKNLEYIVQICIDIAKKINSPERIADDIQNSLYKYSQAKKILHDLLKEDIEYIKNKLYKKQSELEYSTFCSNADLDGFFVFKYLLVESGSEKSLEFINKWFLKGIIQKHELSELLLRTIQTKKNCSEEWMMSLFELVKKLNDIIPCNSVLVEFVKICILDKDGKHLLEETIEYLGQKLDGAIMEGDDNPKVLKYIEIIGYFDHEKVFEIFEKYINDRKQVSQFQRLRMVLSLEKLAKTNNEVLKNAMYQLFNNNQTSQEIRTAAFYILMMSHPTEDMLIEIAKSTRNVKEEYLKSIIQSAIQSSTMLEEQYFKSLKQNSMKAAQYLEDGDYGVQYSKVIFNTYGNLTKNATYFDQLFTLSSKDSISPKNLKFTFGKLSENSTEVPVDLNLGVSSIKNLKYVFQRLFEKFHVDLGKQKENDDAVAEEFSSEYLTRILAIERMEDEQVEGLFSYKFGDMNGLISFDNKSFEGIPENLHNFINYFPQGIKCRNTKIKSGPSIRKMIVMENGFPLIYQKDSAIFSKWNVHFKISSSQPITYGKTIQLASTNVIEMKNNITYCKKLQEKMSFINPFDQKVYENGIDENLNANVPLWISLNLLPKEGNIVLNVGLNNTQTDEEYFSYKKNAYLNNFASNDIMVSYNKRYKVDLHSKYKIKTNFGMAQGFGTEFQYVGDRYDLDLMPEKLPPNADYFYQLFLKYKTLNIDEFILTSLEDKGLSKVQFLIGHKSIIKNEKPCLIEGTENEVVHNCQEISYIASIDFKKIQYNGSLFFVKSNSDPTGNFRFNFTKVIKANLTKPFELHGFVLSKRPNSNDLNMSYALNHGPDINLYMQYQLNWGENAWQLSPHVHLTRSKERKNYIETLPEMNQCKKQMTEGNYQLTSCGNLIDVTNMIDTIDFNLVFKLSELRVAKKVCSMFPCCCPKTLIEEGTLSSYNDTDLKHLNILVKFKPNLTALDLVLSSKGKLIQTFEGLQINEWLSRMVLVNPIHTITTRLKAKALGMKSFRPFCTIDSSAAATFDNEIYPLNLTKKWILVLHYLPTIPRLLSFSQNTILRQKEQLEQFSILTKQNDQNPEGKDFLISLRAPFTNGKLFTIHLESSLDPNSPAIVRVKDGKILQLYENRTNNFHNGKVEIYIVPNNEIKVTVREKFFIVYDGHRLKMELLNYEWRGKISGLCGNFNGEKYDDFLLPNGCYTENSQDFTTIYTIPNHMNAFSGQFSKYCPIQVY